MSRTEWHLRPYRPGDEAGICRLLERGFGRRVDESAWRQKLKLHPSPVENVWLAVDRQDRPIFHYGGIPRQLSLAGKTYPVMVAVDSTTDPEFRRRGILTAGVQAAHQAWASAGIACVLGLPNEQWGSRIQAVGWRPLFPLQWMIRPLRPERLIARRLGWSPRATDRWAFLGQLWRAIPTPRPDSRLEIRSVELMEGAGRLLGNNTSPSLATLSRDRHWLIGRYPSDRYRLLVAYDADRAAGHLAYRFDSENHFGFIAELTASPTDAATRYALLDAAVARLNDLGANAVLSLATPDSTLYRSYRRARFWPRRRAFIVHSVPLAESLPLELLQDPQRFSLQGGDFDVI